MIYIFKLIWANIQKSFFDCLSSIGLFSFLTPSPEPPGTKQTWLNGIHVYTKEGPHPFLRGDFSQIMKIHWQHLKIFFSITTAPISTKLCPKYLWVKGIQWPCLFQGKMTTSLNNSGWIIIAKCSSLFVVRKCCSSKLEDPLASCFEFMCFICYHSVTIDTISVTGVFLHVLTNSYFLIIMSQ